jgi:hypothetical protein
MAQCFYGTAAEAAAAAGGGSVQGPYASEAECEAACDSGTSEPTTGQPVSCCAEGLPILLHMNFVNVSEMPDCTCFSGFPLDVELVYHGGLNRWIGSCDPGCGTIDFILYDNGLPSGGGPDCVQLEGTPVNGGCGTITRTPQPTDSCDPVFLQYKLPGIRFNACAGCMGGAVTADIIITE